MKRGNVRNVTKDGSEAKGGGEGIELATLIRSLRSELAAAMQEGAESPLRFAVNEIELELEVSAARSAEPRAGVKFWVVTAGVGAKIAKSNVQRLKLKLTPRTSDNGRLLIADDSGQQRE